jgi:hypothetical protein
MATTTDFNVGGITANVNAQSINFADGTVQSTAAGVGPNGSQFLAARSKALFVDGSRSDTYVADGTVLKPFKTITAAVNQVIANGDNTPAVPYCITVLAPGVYHETVDLGNAAIVNVSIEGPGTGLGSCSAAVDAIQSIANNDQQSFLCFKNLNIGTLTMIGASNGTNFGSSDCTFLFCQVGSGVFTNCGSPGFITCKLISTVSFINVGNGYLEASSIESGALSLTTQAGNTPAGFGGTFVLIENSRVSANITLTGSGTELEALFSTLGKLDGSTTITSPAGTTLVTKASYVKGTFVA